MKLIEVSNEFELSEIASQIIVEQVRTNPESVLGLATGSTPELTYGKVIEAYNDGVISFKDVTTFNLDEYVGIDVNEPESYHFYMMEKLFKWIDIQLENTHLPNGVLGTIEQCEKYESLLNEHPMDLQILGLGSNGHIGFNEPFVDPKLGVHIVELAEQTRKDNALYFSSYEEVPTHAITMGIQNIMRAKHVLLLVNSEKKKEALSALLKGHHDLKWPVTALIEHPNLTVIAVRSAIESIVD